jgi:hypothetical protein
VRRIGLVRLYEFAQPLNLGGGFLGRAPRDLMPGNTGMRRTTPWLWRLLSGTNELREPRWEPTLAVAERRQAS